MRIALVAPVFEPVPPVRHGGTERTVALLCEALARRGHEVVLFASGDSRAPTSMVAPIARAVRYAEHATDPTTATLVLTALMLLNACASFALAAGWRLLASFTKSFSARARCDLLFALRIGAPVLASTGIPEPVAGPTLLNAPPR